MIDVCKVKWCMPSDGHVKGVSAPPLSYYRQSGNYKIMRQSDFWVKVTIDSPLPLPCPPQPTKVQLSPTRGSPRQAGCTEGPRRSGRLQCWNNNNMEEGIYFLLQWMNLRALETKWRLFHKLYEGNTRVRFDQSTYNFHNIVSLLGIGRYTDNVSRMRQWW